jgi:hypothetical protein
MRRRQGYGAQVRRRSASQGESTVFEGIATGPGLAPGSFGAGGFLGVETVGGDLSFSGHIFGFLVGD